MKCRSEWQTPVAAVRIRTSRGPGRPIWTSSMLNGWPMVRKTAAFIGDLRVTFSRVSYFRYAAIDIDERLQ